MKPAPFEYVAVGSTDEAIGVLAADDEAKVIAGGQSLTPLLALRLARPSVLVDVNGVGLDELCVEPPTPDGTEAVLRIGALVRHRRLELDPLVARVSPTLADAARLIGHPSIRNRGTIGGSLAHADPAAELPAALVALSGSVLVQGPLGVRAIAAADLFTGFLTTTVAPDELIVEVHIPLVRDGATAGSFCEWAPRTGDFAEVGVAVVLTLGRDGVCASVGAAVCGIASVPIPIGPVIESVGVVGATELSDGLLRALAAAVTSTCTGGGEDRAALAGLLAARAVVRAHDRAAHKTRAAA
jgi:aerobic carbon-monoxide dehydrogenase medium subunit